ncbi:MAG: hypothetical protein U0792_22750 [Gemmataceae bacterium]
MSHSKVPYAEFSTRYCERHDSTPERLLDVLKSQQQKWHPHGWVLLECHDLCSSRAGQLAIVPYGPDNTLTSIPDGPISPRGLASDLSVVILHLHATDLPETLPEELQDWKPQ